VFCGDSPARYDALLAEGTPKEVLDAKKIVRVHPAFRVFAIGLPSPPFPGSFVARWHPAQVSHGSIHCCGCGPQATLWILRCDLAFKQGIVLLSEGELGG
jgi:hypothetical protein